MSAEPAPRYTPEEYLELDRASPNRNQYFRGTIYAMSGASPSHGLIVMNPGAELRGNMKPRPFRVYGNELRLKIEKTGLFTYPDVTVNCEKERYTVGRKPDTLVNPLLIVEVLSDSTETYDCATKFEHYQQIPFLSECVLVSQHRAQMESYLRQGNSEQWLFTVARGINAHLILQSTGVTISLAGV